MERSTVGSLLRASQAFCLQLCEKETLDYGIAYYSMRFAGLPDANQYREVIASDRASAASAFDEAQRWFESRGLTWYRWAPADGAAPDELIDFLSDRGFKLRRYAAMVIRTWAEFETPGDVRVLPARAMRGALRETLGEASRRPRGRAATALADAYEERMDDPPFDVFVAMIGKEPAGRCALYQVGDIARIMDLNVLPAFADRGVDAALTAHVLALAKRLAMRNICLQVEADDSARREWFAKAGFVEDGDLVEFERPVPARESVTR